MLGEENMDARMKNPEEIATQGSGLSCGVGVGARVSGSNVFAGTCSKQEKKNNWLIVLYLPCLEWMGSIRCAVTSPCMNRFVLR
jgi:hypothetical protein